MREKIKIWPPEWRPVVRINVNVETPDGSVRLRYLYDRASSVLLKASQSRGSTYKDIGLSRGQVDLLHKRLEKIGKSLVKKTDTLRKNKEELREFRERKAQRAKKTEQGEGKQQKLPL